MEVMEGKMNGSYLRVVSRGLNALLGEFKMALGDVINIGVGYEVYVHSNKN